MLLAHDLLDPLLRTTRAKSHSWPHRSSYNMSDIKPQLDLTSPTSKKRKTPSSSSPDLKPQSPSKAKKMDHRHTFFGPVQKSGAWTQEEDKKLFQHMYPRATGLNWEVIARDIEGRSLHVSRINRLLEAEWISTVLTKLLVTFLS